jgi:hypothetical protein
MSLQGCICRCLVLEGLIGVVMVRVRGGAVLGGGSIGGNGGSTRRGSADIDSERRRRRSLY